jgi:hypothetical protein
MAAPRDDPIGADAEQCLWSASVFAPSNSRKRDIRLECRAVFCAHASLHLFPVTAILPRSGRSPDYARWSVFLRQLSIPPTALERHASLVDDSLILASHRNGERAPVAAVTGIAYHLAKSDHGFAAGRGIIRKFEPDLVRQGDLAIIRVEVVPCHRFHRAAQYPISCVGHIKY